MRNPENIDAVCAAMPDFIGFIFYPKSKRFVGENPDETIFKRVPSTIKKAGVFVNEEKEQLLSVCKKYRLEVAQLHGAEPPEYCRWIRDHGLMVLKAFPLDDDFDFSQLDDYIPAVDYFLFDTKGKLPGGTGEKFNWKILNRYRGPVPFFLSGGIGPDDAGDILKMDHPQLVALDINSGFELRPGLKDAAKTASFIQKIRNY